MVTVSVGGVLIGILLIALIVLVVYLIVLVSNLTDTVKKANAILDGSISAAEAAKERADNMTASVKEGAAKVGNAAATGINAGRRILDKVTNVL